LSALQHAGPAIDETIAANLARVRERIAAAADRSGRSPGSVRLVGVSKTFPAAAVISAAACGLDDIGENRVQEAASKVAEVANSGAHPRWHLIGHLQTNKVRQALELFDVIHSVDSVHLAQAISSRAQRPVEILLEVNIGGESSKDGFDVEAAATATPIIAALTNIRLRGLMTVAPAVEDPEEVRPVFRRLRELNERLGLHDLSMGMSGDYEVAISEGSTLVRVGRAIFGTRA
jgi:pyridoxal phosphate enzyme (YggS family)